MGLKLLGPRVAASSTGKKLQNFQFTRLRCLAPGVDAERNLLHRAKSKQSPGGARELGITRCAHLAPGSAQRKKK